MVSDGIEWLRPAKTKSTETRRGQQKTAEAYRSLQRPIPSYSLPFLQVCTCAVKKLTPENKDQTQSEESLEKMHFASEMPSLRAIIFTWSKKIVENKQLGLQPIFYSFDWGKFSPLLRINFFALHVLAMALMLVTFSYIHIEKSLPRTIRP